MFGTYRKTYGIRLNALLGEFFLGKLAVRGGCGVDNKALDIGNIGKQ